MSWSSTNAFDFGVGGLRFKFPANQIELSVANGSPPLQHFFRRTCVAFKHNEAEIGPATHYMFRRNTARIMKNFVW